MAPAVIVRTAPARPCVVPIADLSPLLQHRVRIADLHGGLLVASNWRPPAAAIHTATGIVRQQPRTSPALSRHHRLRATFYQSAKGAPGIKFVVSYGYSVAYATEAMLLPLKAVCRTEARKI